MYGLVPKNQSGNLQEANEGAKEFTDHGMNSLCKYYRVDGHTLTQVDSKEKESVHLIIMPIHDEDVASDPTYRCARFIPFTQTTSIINVPNVLPPIPKPAVGTRYATKVIGPTGNNCFLVAAIQFLRCMKIFDNIPPIDKQVDDKDYLFYRFLDVLKGTKDKYEALNPGETDSITTFIRTKLDTIESWKRRNLNLNTSNEQGNGVNEEIYRGDSLIEIHPLVYFLHGEQRDASEFINYVIQTPVLVDQEKNRYTSERYDKRYLLVTHLDERYNLPLYACDGQNNYTLSSNTVEEEKIYINVDGDAQNLQDKVEGMYQEIEKQDLMEPSDFGFYVDTTTFIHKYPDRNTSFKKIDAKQLPPQPSESTIKNDFTDAFSDSLRKNLPQNSYVVKTTPPITVVPLQSGQFIDVLGGYSYTRAELHSIQRVPTYLIFAIRQQVMNHVVVQDDSNEITTPSINVTQLTSFQFNHKITISETDFHLKSLLFFMGSSTVSNNANSGPGHYENFTKYDDTWWRYNNDNNPPSQHQMVDTSKDYVTSGDFYQHGHVTMALYEQLG